MNRTLCNVALGCIGIASIFGFGSLVAPLYDQADLVFDSFVLLMLISNVTLFLGLNIQRWGQSKALAFGKEAGVFVTFFGTIIPCLVFTVCCLTFIASGNSEIFTAWPVKLLAALALPLLLSFAAIIELMMRRQREQLAEIKSLRQQLGKCRNRDAENSRTLKSYKLAWDEICDDIANRDCLSGREIVHKFKSRQREIRKSLTDTFRKSRG